MTTGPTSPGPTPPARRHRRWLPSPPQAPRSTAVDTAWILARIARPAPSRTPFVELRGSPLLKQPLRVEGVYRRPDAGTLVREVRAPYTERTTIRAGEVAIERAGKSTRRFPLSRAPELEGLQSSFAALLSGDAERLQRRFEVRREGRRDGWRLHLAPRDPALAARLRGLVLHGRGAELRCIETRPTGDGAIQRTLLAGAAQAAGAQADATALAAICRGDAHG